MHGGFMFADMVTLLPTIAPLIMIAGFFAIVWDFFGPLFNIIIRMFEIVPLLFNPTELANEIIIRSNNYIKEQDEEDIKIINEKVIDEKLKNLEGINNKMLALLVKENIVTLNDFADLASFELIDKQEGIFKSLDIDEEKINSMIMKARESWFEDK